MLHEPSFEEQWRRKLLNEGFDHIFIWRDGPNVTYTDHAHPFSTCHVILDGEMTVVTEDVGKILKPGDRMDVPRGVLHSSKMGNTGCRYIIAEKYIG